MNKSFLSTLASACVLSTSFATNIDNTMTVQVSQSDKTFAVQLPANPTTGFQWKVLQYDTALFKLISQKYVSPQTHLVGAGGTTYFTFQLQKGKHIPKHTEMTFSYARPWLASKGEQHKIIVNFK